MKGKEKVETLLFVLWLVVMGLVTTTREQRPIIRQWLLLVLLRETLLDNPCLSDQQHHSHDNSINRLIRHKRHHYYHQYHRRR
jgi:hypothetical protein